MAAASRRGYAPLTALMRRGYVTCGWMGLPRGAGQRQWASRGFRVRPRRPPHCCPTAIGSSRQALPVHGHLPLCQFVRSICSVRGPSSPRDDETGPPGPRDSSVANRASDASPSSDVGDDALPPRAGVEGGHGEGGGAVVKSGAEAPGGASEAPLGVRHVDTVDNEHIWTIPNMLTMSRIVAAPVLAALVINDYHSLAVWGFAAAGACDWLDGFIARRFNMTSVLGSYLDPVADKVLVGCLAAAMAYKGMLALPVVGLVLIRDIGLVSGAFWYRYKTKPEGKRFFDVKTSATFEVKPSVASKFNTAAQLAWITLSLTHAAYGMPPEIVNTGLSAFVFGTTFWSGYGYWKSAGIGQIKMPQRMRERLDKTRAAGEEWREKRKVAQAARKVRRRVKKEAKQDAKARKREAKAERKRHS